MTRLTGTHTKVLSVLGADPMTPKQIAQRIGTTDFAVEATLRAMRLRGEVKRMARKHGEPDRYRRAGA